MSICSKSHSSTIDRPALWDKIGTNCAPLIHLPQIGESGWFKGFQTALQPFFLFFSDTSVLKGKTASGAPVVEDGEVQGWGGTENGEVFYEFTVIAVPFR